MMSDSIIFLGTAGDALSVGKQLRASGGIILQLEGSQFVLDPGPGCLVQAKGAGINIRDTVAVMASHPATIRSSDLNAVIDALTVSGLDTMGVVIAPKSVISGTDSEIPVLRKKYHSCVERVIELEPGRRISVNNVNIITTTAKHKDTDAIGFIFETQKYRLGYTSDTEFTDETAEQYKNCDVLILNVKNPGSAREEGHMSVEDAVHFLRKAKPGKAVITHFGVKMLQSDILAEARHLQRETKVDVLAASDGLILVPSGMGVMSQARVAN